MGNNNTKNDQADEASNTNDIGSPRTPLLRVKIEHARTWNYFACNFYTKYFNISDKLELYHEKGIHIPFPVLKTLIEAVDNQKINVETYDILKQMHASGDFEITIGTELFYSFIAEDPYMEDTEESKQLGEDSEDLAD